MAEFDSEEEVFNEKLEDSLKEGANYEFDPPKIIYSSRTHSQIAQFLHEIKKTVYADLKCVTLGSRKNLCINDSVSKLKDMQINDKCIELQGFHS